MLTNAMSKLFILLLEHPERARELPFVPCGVLAALAIDDDENMRCEQPLDNLHRA